MDSLPWAVRKRRNRSRCSLECWVWWVHGRWAQWERGTFKRDWL